MHLCAGRLSGRSHELIFYKTFCEKAVFPADSCRCVVDDRPCRSLGIFGRNRAAVSRSGPRSHEREKLGLQAAAQVYQQMPVLPDSSPETQYIQSLGKRLVAVIPADRTWPYQFHVVAQKEVNAFALPGGPMFVNIGTITSADNEAELASVMAHEMGHVYMQHGAKQARKAGIANIIGAIAGAVGGSAVGEGVQLGAGALLLKYSREDEAQADAFGAIVLWHAHYNPIALSDFFKKLGSNSSNGPQFLSDHPNPGNREEAIQNQVRGWPPGNYNADSPEFASARTHARGVHAYAAQEIPELRMLTLLAEPLSAGRSLF